MIFDFFNNFLFRTISAPRDATWQHTRWPYSSVIKLLYVLSSPLQSRLFDFFLYDDVRLLLLPFWLCSAVSSVLFCVVLSLAWNLMLFSARRAAITSSNSDICFCMSSPILVVDTYGVLNSASLLLSSSSLSFLASSAKRLLLSSKASRWPKTWWYPLSFGTSSVMV